MHFKTIEWNNNQVIMLDQRLLPQEEVYHTYKTYQEVGAGIKDMVIRGAPAIGVAAAMGVAIGVKDIQANNFEDFWNDVEKICEELFQTRPTAVNLGWALERMKAFILAHKDKNFDEIKTLVIEEAKRVCEEDKKLNRKLGENGHRVLSDGDTVLTHCNAGALATAGFGTALGVIYAAKLNGKKIQVFADETRPYLQGSRLTAWELHKNDIPTTLITDNMAAWMMKKGEIQKVIVGADRIAANGDTANKIGTYGVALLAKEHKIPFYVAAPLSTIDLSLKSGEEIPIEERSAQEVTEIKGQSIAPEGIQVRHPAFDVTPNRLITAIITEKGLAENPFEDNIKALFDL